MKAKKKFTPEFKQQAAEIYGKGRQSGSNIRNRKVGTE